MAKPITWLHISDIHMGCRGKELWWQVHQEFGDIIRAMVAEHGTPDLLLITGDIAWSGQKEEYEAFDIFLDQLLNWLTGDGGRAPLIIPVPGNHDLDMKCVATNPMLGLFGTALGKETWPAQLPYLEQLVWEGKGTTPFHPLFKNYLDWFNRRILHQLGSPCLTSPFPGDLAVQLNLPGKFPLTVVGINSAWMHYQKGNFHGKMELLTRQLQATLADGSEKNPLDAIQKNALLLMHHPLSWFSTATQAMYKQHIHPPGRFQALLCGHAHIGDAEFTRKFGDKGRCAIMTPSLFGLEDYQTPQENRSMGFMWGSLSQRGDILLWPYLQTKQGGGNWAFTWDPRAKEHMAGARVCDGDNTIGRINLEPWLQSLLDRTDHIKISGIGSGRGLAKEAKPTYPIEDLYTALKSRDDRQDMSRGHETVLLQQLLPRHPRLLIEGAPGSGKSTFLNLVATMLARDLLNHPSPLGSSWRQHHLGFDTSSPAKIPLLLKLANLEKVLTSKKGDDRYRLLDLLAETPNASSDPAWRRHWEERLDAGEVMLLLDGLDEVANLQSRERVFIIFKDALRHWGQCPMVVTSRPFETERLKQLDFQTSTIAPFEAKEIREFLDRWVAALHGLALGQRPDDTVAAQVDTLNKAIVERVEIRRMATNPVMLTCLCVVHWNEGQLPEGRARVYQAVINWLIKSREGQRKEAGFTNELAERAFPRLALTMMGDGGGKRPILGLEQAAEAVTALVARQCSLTNPEDIRLKARKWLAFECLWSGILEETGRNNVKFWHLTFQEYLAARQLAWLGDDPATGWWPSLRPHLVDPQWRETVELFPGCLMDGGDASVDLLLQRVLREAGPHPDLAKEARVAGIMGRLLAPMAAYGYKPHAGINAPWQQLLTRTMAIFTAEGAAKVPVQDRIAAAEALGEGDPRLRALTLLPVPGTEWLLGKYLVTVMEYQRFMEHGGYQEQRWWDDAGWQKWEAPNGWDNQLLHPNRPVTGVSWFEAMAYCRWLSDQNNMILRLSDEALWKKATQGKYPWGKEKPTPKLANFGSNVGSPTPVGLYPAGDGPFGHCDLAGNVWEWQRNLYENENATDTPLDVYIGKDDEMLALRGGSWLGDAVNLRAAYRLRDHAVNRYDLMGFRLAAAPAST